MDSCWFKAFKDLKMYPETSLLLRFCIFYSDVQLNCNIEHSNYRWSVNV